MRVLGIFGDHLLATKPGQDASEIAVYSFATGDRLGDPVNVDGYVAYGLPFPGGIVTDRLQVISAADGSVRTLHDPGPTPDLEVPTRVVAVSENGRRLATSICASGIEDAYNCRPTSFIDIESGALVDTLDAGPMPVSRFTNTWVLTRSYTAAAMFDPNGRQLWTSGDLARGDSEEVSLWYLDILDGDIVATAQGIDGAREVVVRIEPLTGRQRVLFTEPDGEDWRFWTGWSTDRYAVFGHTDAPDSLLHGGCGDCVAPTADAGVLDLKTGAFDPDAIHVNLTP